MGPKVPAAGGGGIVIGVSPHLEVGAAYRPRITWAMVSAASWVPRGLGWMPSPA